MSAALDTQNATRARIADAAERLFRTLGYQKTAVADIARECGMSPANVYRFFARQRGGPAAPGHPDAARA